MYDIKQSVAIDVPFFLHDTSGIPVTGATITTKRISKGSGGAFGALTITIAEMENGFYKASLTTSHTDTVGLLTITFSDGTNPQVNLQWRVEANLADDLATSIGNLSSGSAAISTVAESATVTTGTETLTYAATSELDATTHDIAAVAGNTELYYQFDVGGNGVPTEVLWNGYANSNADSYSVKAYNWGTTSWEQIGTIAGTISTSIIENTFQLTNAHVGTGVNLGKVRWQITSADGTKFATDRILCSYAVVAQSVGYAGGAIWVDTNASNTNTEVYVDGVADNPVSTWAAALTINSTLGLNRFKLAPGSSITLSANSDSYNIEGYGSTVALNGQSVNGTAFHGVEITGNDDGSNVSPTAYRECHIGTSTLGLHELIQCHFTGNITLAEAGDYIWDHCASFVAGSGTPDVTFPVGNANLSLRHYSGGMEINAMAAGDKMSMEGEGQFKIAADCTGGAVSIRGCIGPITDLASGAVTITENARIANDTINAEVDTGIADALNDIADAILKRDFSAVSGEADRSALNALRFLRNKWSVSGSTLTVTKEDDSTAAWTAALTTDAAADPVTASDPA